MIYFVQQGTDGPIKIGYSRDLRALRGRLSALQTGHAHDLHLRTGIRGERSDEALFHRYFAANRLRGEWFSLTRDLVYAASGPNAAENVLDDAWCWFRYIETGLMDGEGRLTTDGLQWLMTLELNASMRLGWDIPGVT